MNFPVFNPLVPPPAYRRPASLPDRFRRPASVKKVASLAAAKVVASMQAPRKKKFSDRVKGVVGADVYSDIYNAFVSMRYDFTSWFATAIGIICLIRYGSDLSGLTVPDAVKDHAAAKIFTAMKMQLAGMLIMLPSVIDFTPSQFPAASRISRPVMIVMIVIWCLIVPEPSVLYFSIQNFLVRMLMRTRLPSSYLVITCSIGVLWYASFTTTGKKYSAETLKTLKEVAKQSGL